MKKFIKKYTDCIVVRGAGRAMILDMKDRHYELIPLAMADFLAQIEGRTEEEVYGMFAPPEHHFVDEYLQYLKRRDFIFYCDSLDELALFPPLSLEWRYPAIITNAVIDVSTVAHVERFLAAKQSLLIPYIQVNVLSNISAVADLELLLQPLLVSEIKGIQLYYDNAANLPVEDLVLFCNSTAQLETLVGFNSRENKSFSSAITHLRLTTEKDYSKGACGKVNTGYFNLEPQHFFEAQQHNTCLNRKIAIDIDGEIRNCPSMTKSYGNIRTLSLLAAIDLPGFKDLWHLGKDAVSVCMDCEFRYICTDCRAYLDTPSDINSKPLKCGYDPYSCTWEDVSSNPMKQETASVYYHITL